jgi:hypothetical protein
MNQHKNKRRKANSSDSLSSQSLFFSPDSSISKVDNSYGSSSDLRATTTTEEVDRKRRRLEGPVAEVGKDGHGRQLHFDDGVFSPDKGGRNLHHVGQNLMSISQYEPCGNTFVDAAEASMHEDETDAHHSSPSNKAPLCDAEASSTSSTAECDSENSDSENRSYSSIEYIPEDNEYMDSGDVCDSQEEVSDDEEQVEEEKSEEGGDVEEAGHGDSDGVGIAKSNHEVIDASNQQKVDSSEGDTTDTWKVLDYERYKFLMEDPINCRLVKLYTYCINAKVTHASYESLYRLLREDLGTDAPEIPATFKTLNKKVRKIVDQVYPKLPPPHKTQIKKANGEHLTVCTPFVNLKQAVGNMLMDSNLVTDIKRNMEYLPVGDLSEVLNSWSLEEELPDIRERMKNKICEISYGSAYYSNLVETRQLWKKQYRAAKANHREVLVTTLAIYEDDFSLDLSSKVSQSLCMVTCLDGRPEGVKIHSLSNQVICLANVNVAKQHTDDMLWKHFTADANELAAGVVYTVYNTTSKCNEEILVIAQVLLVLGDSPASKRLTGFSTSSNHTLACRLCWTLTKDFGPSILNPAKKKGFKSKNEIKEICDKYGGKKLDHEAKEALKLFGMKRSSEFFVKWENQGDVRRQPPDYMHTLCCGQGVNSRLFCHVFSVLVEAKHGAAVTKKQKATIMKKISREFSRLCKLNRMRDVFTSFNDEDHFCKLNGSSSKMFTYFSVHILIAVELVPSRFDLAAWECYYTWCEYVTVANIIHSKDLERADIDTLTTRTTSILRYLQEKIPGCTYIKAPTKRELAKNADAVGKTVKETAFMTLNPHYLTHNEELIDLLGPPYKWSNWSREGMIGKLKPLYRNTNSTNKEVSVLENYRVRHFFEIVATMDRNSKTSAGSSTVYKLFIPPEAVKCICMYNDTTIPAITLKFDIQYQVSYMKFKELRMGYCRKDKKFNHQVTRVGDVICMKSWDECGDTYYAYYAGYFVDRFGLEYIGVYKPLIIEEIESHVYIYPTLQMDRENAETLHCMPTKCFVRRAIIIQSERKVNKKVIIVNNK